MGHLHGGNRVRKGDQIVGIGDGGLSKETLSDWGGNNSQNSALSLQESF